MTLANTAARGVTATRLVTTTEGGVGPLGTGGMDLGRLAIRGLTAGLTRRMEDAAEDARLVAAAAESS